MTSSEFTRAACYALLSNRQASRDELESAAAAAEDHNHHDLARLLRDAARGRR